MGAECRGDDELAGPVGEGAENDADPGSYVGARNAPPGEDGEDDDEDDAPGIGPEDGAGSGESEGGGAKLPLRNGLAPGGMLPSPRGRSGTPNVRSSFTRCSPVARASRGRSPGARSAPGTRPWRRAWSTCR